MKKDMYRNIVLYISFFIINGITSHHSLLTFWHGLDVLIF